MNTCDVKAVAISWKPHTALFIVGSTPLIASDQSQHDRLVSLGYTVTVVTDAAAVASDALGKTIVLASESVASGTLGSKFRDVATAVIICEGNCLPFMKMANGILGTDYNDEANYEQVTITDKSHPLAAGLSGTVLIYPDSWGEMNWGLPNANGVQVAYMTGYASKWAIFCYDTGVTMCGGYSAQARRVGLFIRQPAASHTTSDCWKFFDAAVKWAAGES